MQRRCCCPPDSSKADFFSLSFTSSHSAASLERALDALVDQPAVADAVHAQSICDVLIDRLRKRIRFLENHAYLFAQLDDLDVPAVDVLAVDPDLAAEARSLDQIVHPVQQSQESRLAAPEGPIKAVTVIISLDADQ